MTSTVLPGFQPWAWAGTAGMLHAPRSLHVRAGSRRERHPRRGANVVHFDGSLRDDLDAPLPLRSIRLRGEPAEPADGAEAPEQSSREVRSDASGEFSETLSLRLGRYRIEAAYDGDGVHEASQTSEVFDLALADVQLAITLESGRTIARTRPTSRTSRLASRPR